MPDSITIPKPFPVVTKAAYTHCWRCGLALNKSNKTELERGVHSKCAIRQEKNQLPLPLLDIDPDNDR